MMRKGKRMTKTWIEKTVKIDEWVRVQDRFEKHFMALRAPNDMMLVSVDEFGTGNTKLIAGLQDDTLLRLYPGFRPMSEGALPKKATLLVRHNAAFEKHFEYFGV
jgi:hypothetical protein